MPSNLCTTTYTAASILRYAAKWWNEIAKNNFGVFTYRTIAFVYTGDKAYSTNLIITKCVDVKRWISFCDTHTHNLSVYRRRIFAAFSGWMKRSIVECINNSSSQNDQDQGNCESAKLRILVHQFESRSIHFHSLFGRDFVNMTWSSFSHLNQWANREKSANATDTFQINWIQ